MKRMKRIAKFEKVSFEQFEKDCKNCGMDFHQEILKEIYDEIKLPKRATTGSAGYDFFTPFYLAFGKKNSKKFPTGIRCKIEDGWVLKLYPRSSLGFKFRLQLNNTVGIIDSDYFYSDNEGHIHAKMTYDTNDIVNEPLVLERGTAFSQGIFVPFGITVDDNATEVRNGGFGSTDK